MSRIINRMDKLLFILTIIMFVFGLFMILDASSMKSFMEYGINTKYFSKQLVILILSLIVSIFVILIPVKIYKRFIVPITIGLVIVMIYLLIGGEVTSGTKSWLYIMGFGHCSLLSNLFIFHFCLPYISLCPRILT